MVGDNKQARRIIDQSKPPKGLLALHLRYFPSPFNPCTFLPSIPYVHRFKYRGTLICMEWFRLPHPPSPALTPSKTLTAFQISF